MYDWSSVRSTTRFTPPSIFTRSRVSSKELEPRTCSWGRLAAEADLAGKTAVDAKTRGRRTTAQRGQGSKGNHLAVEASSRPTDRVIAPKAFERFKHRI